MKTILGYTVALLTALVLLSSPALGVDYPHNTANGYTCSGCHQSHSTLGTQGYTNLCLTCHNPADGKGGNKSFVPGDASNPFGNATSARPGTLYQTSHNWSGSDNVPPAGALPPLNPQMTKDNMRGTISCVRCHNVKNPRSSAFNSAPFLRTLNERDEMCLDCHRQRNSTSHLSGSHPVTVSYSGAASVRPAAFYSEPVNSNPGNPTSALKLVGGEVLCSTCHRVHFADSASATYDSATSARQGSLVPSAGKLLRTDLRGSSAAVPNICSNCHAGKGSHNNKGQNVQCADCHSGHVAYDAQAVTDEEKKPNVYLIRRYMNISSSAGAVRNGRVFFQYTGSSRNYVDYRGTGICQGCHPVPQGPGYPPEHTSTAANVCSTCHGHQTAIGGSFSANCTSCHGFPPPSAAAGYSGVNETSSPHRRHAGGGTNYQYSCNECHKGNSHNTNTFQDVYLDRTGILAGSSATYDTSTRTCSNVYCHGVTMSVANDRNGGTNITPVWSNSASGQCGTCHGTTTTSPPVRGSHKTHAGSGQYWYAPNTDPPFNNYLYGRQQPCSVCHVSYPAGHVDGKAEWSFDSTTYPWLAGANYRGAANGSASSVPNASYGQCSNLYCHSIVQTSTGGPLTGLPGEYKTPSWGVRMDGNCGSCHFADEGHSYWAGRGMGTPEVGSGSHTKHLQFLTVTVGGGANGPARCAACHNYVGSDSLTGCASVCHNGSALHVDHRIDVKFPPMYGATAAYTGTPQPGDGYGACSTLYCHSNGTSIAAGTVPAVTSPPWGGSAMTCSACHGNPPAYANGLPKANSHQRHNFACNSCHNATTSDGTTITGVANHVNRAYNVNPGGGTSFSYSFNAVGGSCSAISCHGTTSAQWGASSCLGCHSVVQGNRAAVTSQFGGSSHHVQGELTDAKCYQCHWEANSNGTINATYHGGAAASGSPVDLVIYGAAARPTTFTAGATAVQYTADGSRGQIEKVTSHCLGCHSDQNNATDPFGDGKTPKQYAWDGTSVAARYAQTGKTTWGKYSTVANAAQKRIAKSLSAHGNAAGNQRGWNTSTGVDGAIANTSGGTGVQCYDCHNSHGSSVAGITSRYSSATGKKRGGLLKETVNGQGGYATSYKPEAGGSAADKNVRSPGASICLDCHLNQTATSTPWGYGSTYGASQAILGYWDAPKYKDYSTSGAEQRYPFKKMKAAMGGHYGASAPLSSSPTGSIDGLCTPCHDPHGVSPTLGADQQYAVPLLKGTWLTSPYKEDTAPRDNVAGTIRTDKGLEGAPYHIDQNTFLAGGITQPVDKSAGLCVGCHPKSSLTDGVTHTWKGKDRVHESVKDWKTSTGTKQHSYSCSKCHTSHDNSVLPRLMVTNCLDSRHKSRVGYTPSAIVAGSGWGDYDTCNALGPALGECWALYPGGPGAGDGGGRIPGAWGGTGVAGSNLSCHEGQTGSGTNQGWNMVTPWIWEPPIVITSGPTTGSMTAVGSNVQAIITWGSNLAATSYVDYGLTTGYSSTAGNATLVGSHSVLLSSLTNHSTYHYRVRSVSDTGRSIVSGDQSFYISVPPTVPTLITKANFVSATSTPVTLQWNASTDPDSGPIQYNVEVDTSSSFNSANKQASGWFSGTSWTPSLATNATWYWRVKARDGNYTTAQDPPSAWSATQSFIMSDGAPPPAPALASPLNSFNNWSCDSVYSMGFSWSSVAVPLPDYLVQVSTDPTFAAVSYQSGWITATNWVTSVATTATYYWRVQARNPLSLAVGPWSSVNAFTITDTGPCATTCPMVYTWDGANFAFESDVYTKGKLALKYSTGFLKPNPNDYYLLLNTPVKTDGAYELKIVEERAETDYLDSLRLYTIDFPENRDVYSEILFSSTAYVEPVTLIHTVDRTLKKPISASRVSTGEDVSVLLAAADENHVVLSNDRNLDFTWQTIELDLGDLSTAPQVKLIVNAVSAFPTTPAGLSRASSLDFNGQRTKIEVLDANGNWVNVPKATKELPIPKGFRRPYVLDISNIFLTNVFKVRLSFLYKTHIDAIAFDTTIDEPVSVNEVPLVSATLDYYGFSATRGTSEIYEHIYGDKVDKQPSYMPGNYTRYGDVGTLLTQTDDKFVIFGSGDEVTLRFNGETAKPAGRARRFLMYFDGYYKAHNNVFIPNTVEPLPFASMSNFPYDPAVESYPQDTDHNLYQNDYNTRVYAP